MTNHSKYAATKHRSRQQSCEGTYEEPKKAQASSLGNLGKTLVPRRLRTTTTATLRRSASSSKPATVQSEGTMAFRPDILVTSPEEPRVAIVIEAKVHIPNLERTELHVPLQSQL